MTKKIEGMAELEDMPDGTVKVHFAPGCFDNFDGTQEELDEAIAHITKMFNGLDLEKAEEIGTPLTEDDFNQLPEDTQQALIRALSDGSKRVLQ
jgi:hypothetical protein